MWWELEPRDLQKTLATSWHLTQKPDRSYQHRTLAFFSCSFALAQDPSAPVLWSLGVVLEAWLSLCSARADKMWVSLGPKQA